MIALRLWSWWFHRLTLELGCRILLVSPECLSLLLLSVSLFNLSNSYWKGLEDNSAYVCLHMLQCIIFTCLACSPCRSGPFSGSVSTVEDDYSRATLGKQSGMDSRQSVPEQKTDSKCLWLLSFYFAMRVITRTKERTGKEHDMRYFCFRPWWYEIPLLLKKRRMKQHMYLLWLSPHASIDRFLLPYLYSRFLVSSLGEKKLSISKGVAGRAPSEVRKSWTFSSGLPCHKRRRSTYIEIISSGGIVLLPVSTNVSSISERTPLRFLHDAPSISERHVVVRTRLCLSSFDKVARVFWKAEKASPNFALVG